MGISRVFLFVSFVLSLARTGSAREFTGPSRTCLQSQKTANPGDILPLYSIEYMNCGTEFVGSPNVSLQFGGWLRYDSTDGAFFMCDGRQNNERCRVCHK